jgi:hypothetical protein
VTDQFATIFSRELRIDEDSILFVALRSLIRAWRERCYDIDPRQATPTPATDGSALSNFLTRFDLPYRIRRLRFVLRKLDTLYGLQLAHDRVPDYNNHPAYQEALATRAFGLGLPARETEPPERPAADLTTVRLPLARECAKLQRTLRQLLEQRELPDTDTPAPSATTSDDDLRPIVQAALPGKARKLLLCVLHNIAGIPSEALKERQPPSGQRPFLTTQPLDRPASESRLTDLACDRRAASLLDAKPELSGHVDDVAKAIAESLARLFDRAHQAAVEAFGAGDAGRIARRYYQCFNYFDCVQPMTFGTDIGEPDIIDIVRICPEDAPALVPEAAERRAKLKGLAVAHFGAFLDRDWRVSDLLWGRLDAAERIITALLPLQESKELRDKLVCEAHEAILEDFEARPRLGKMAINLARNQGSRHPRFQQTVQRVKKAIAPATAAATRLLGKMGMNLARRQGSRDPPSQPTVQRVIDAITPATAKSNRASQTAFMSLWRMLVPAEPDRVMLMRSLARGTTITGRILDGIAGGSRPPAAWLTNAGRALWALVEISIPRHWGTLLGRYWQSLLLLISIILIVAGLLTAIPAISGFGWAVLALAVFLIVVRTILWDFMRAGRVRMALIGLAILITAGVLLIGGLDIYNRVSARWGKVQAWTCQKLQNCPTQPAASEPRPPG